ncbi:MAG TPA: hypothetical protein VES69_07160, partial [Pyrinomonadaceae bacterium]|nr:hypothetical protein [Pyrinomonadaceae bacterium]
MRKVVLALGAVSLSLCFALPLQMANSARPSDAFKALSASTERTGSGDNFFKSPNVTPQAPSDIGDSDEFFQRALRTVGPERDNTQKIEALLKRMTLEEKVGQMTQLTISMIASGSDQNIKIDPAKLEKAIVKYGVGS